MLTELHTRMIPYEPIEVSHARNRPLDERSPIPKVGDKVFYRREFWDQEPLLTTVVFVQDLNDKSDPNLWHLVRDIYGNPIVDYGVVRYAQVADPWPEVMVEWEEVYKSTPSGVTTRRAVTREARLRGSPGWLPLNWRFRLVRTSGELLSVIRPELPPLNVPFDEFKERR